MILPFAMIYVYIFFFPLCVNGPCLQYIYILSLSVTIASDSVPAVPTAGL